MSTALKAMNAAIDALTQKMRTAPESEMEALWRRLGALQDVRSRAIGLSEAEIAKATGERGIRRQDGSDEGVG